MKKISLQNLINNLYKFILITLLILTGYVCYQSIFDTYDKIEILKPSIIILGSITLIFLLISIKKYIQKLNNKTVTILSMIILIGYLILLIIFGKTFTSVPTYDLFNILDEVNKMFNNNGYFTIGGYLDIHPNQKPLTLLIFYIYKFANTISISASTLSIIINSLFITIAALFTFLSIRKIYNNKMALISIIFIVINPIFYLYSSYYYTDTTCLPFATISIYLFILSLNKNSKKKILYLLFSSIVLSFGFKIRAVVGILLIAYIMTYLFYNNTKKIKDKLISLFVILIGFFLGTFLCSKLIEKHTLTNENNLEVPITHFIMMGTNFDSNGKYSYNDFKYTTSLPTYKEKIYGNLDTIKERLKDKGLSNTINLAKEKLAITWSNGDYDYVSKFYNTSEANGIYDYLVGNKKIFAFYFLQICKTTLLILLLVGIICEVKNKDKQNKNRFIYIALFGAFLFYLLWEVLSRYSLSFFHWIMLIIPLGISLIEKVIKQSSINISSKNMFYKIDIQKIIKKILIITMSLTIFLLLANYYKYVIKEKEYWDLNVVQSWGDGNSINKISNSIITQTFKTNKPFNSIAIKFLKENITSKTNYKFILENSDKEKIYEFIFNSSDILDKYYKTFIFEEDIIPNGKETYIIKISSENATDNNSIGIATHGTYDYDVYNDGKLFIDGDESSGDISFKIQYKNYRQYTTNTIYVFISLLIIAIQIISFYPFIKRNRITTK